jgi:ABC-type amino acid transport substrate-binding protein
VRAATTLAFSSSALEAHVAAQLAPVWGIERSQLRPDWHGYAASFVVRRSIAARKDNALLSTVNTSLAKLRNDGTLKTFRAAA